MCTRHYASGPMSARITSRVPKAVALFAVIGSLGVTGCGFGEDGITVSKDSPQYEGAELFAANCAGCHTLSASGSVGTGNRGTRVQGPNLNQRPETKESVLYAIRNGGYSGAIMPQNIVVGEEAEKVASFVAEYAGTESASK